jgi:heparinase II/III-like protein
VVTVESLVARRDEIAAAPDLLALRDRLAQDAAAVLRHPLHLPSAKALLSRDGGVCPDDGERLRFDPWEPNAHRCPRCGRMLTGERHHRAWVMTYQLWLAERAVHLALLGALDPGERTAEVARACDILTAYGERYPTYPNRDNVLGPGRVFFSTYLESIWLINLLTAGTILRESEGLTGPAEAALNGLAEESIGYIGEFDEHFSNRQVWNDVAMLAAADWFQDEDLGLRALESPTGLMAQVHVGLARDGIWYEGENYHFFVLRALLHAVGWARRVDYDLLRDAKGGDLIRAAFRNPTRTALPDLTFPARKDSAFGGSFLQRRFAELWEVGYALTDDPELVAFLHRLYSAGAPPAARPDDERAAHVSDVERNAPASQLSRSDLSWMALLWMKPGLPAAETPVPSPSVAFDRHGLVVLRHDDRYASVECGAASGGHDHPDRLHLTLHARGEPWLLDFGTGSYVSDDLFWYRSTLAHNAPVVNGRSQQLADAHCVAFDQQGDWSWSRCRLDGGTAYHGVALERTLVAGPDYLLDVVEGQGGADLELLLPWHFLGTVSVESPGEWEPIALNQPFVTGERRFRPAKPGAIALAVRRGEQRLDVWISTDGALIDAEAPGPPRTGRSRFIATTARGSSARMVTLMVPGRSGLDVTGLEEQQGKGKGAEWVIAGREEHRHAGTPRGWRIATPSGVVELGGFRQTHPRIAAIADLSFINRPEPARGIAVAAAARPPLDGSLEGFHGAEPLHLETEDQYRRAEEQYGGPEHIRATAHPVWDGQGLYLAIEVKKKNPVFRPPGAPPLLLDNEPDDIHSDGVQIYVDLGSGESHDDALVYGFLVVPESTGSGLRVSAVAGTAARADMVTGGWRRTREGYCLALGLALPRWNELAVAGTRLGFDLLVNHMEPGRERRSGQLVWSGRNGWVWLQGDRQHPARFGELELVP